MTTPLSPAVFLDRDGTLHRDIGYMIRFEDFQTLPGVEEALKTMQDFGFRLFVATNQSGVARGLFSLDQVMELNRKIQGYFRERGINLEAVAVCPHHPQGTIPEYTRECDCRKPKPGMLIDLANRYGLDLSRSHMVGDNPRDAEAGIAAGCRGALVRPKADQSPLDNGDRLKEFDSLMDFAQSLARSG